MRENILAIHVFIFLSVIDHIHYMIINLEPTKYQKSCQFQDLFHCLRIGKLLLSVFWYGKYLIKKRVYLIMSRFRSVMTGTHNNPPVGEPLLQPNYHIHEMQEV